MLNYLWLQNCWTTSDHRIVELPLIAGFELPLIRELLNYLWSQNRWTTSDHRTVLWLQKFWNIAQNRIFFSTNAKWLVGFVEKWWVGNGEQVCKRVKRNVIGCVKWTCECVMWFFLRAEFCTQCIMLWM